MTDKGGILIFVVIEQRNEIACQVLNIIGRDVGRVGRIAIAPLVGDDGMVTCRDKGRQLMAP